MHDLIPLNQLGAGQLAEVSQVLGNAEQVHRLEELGVRSGAEVEMLQAGIPCIIRLAGSKLCFRENEMFSVLVRVGVSS